MKSDNGLPEDAERDEFDEEIETADSSSWNSEAPAAGFLALFKDFQADWGTTQMIEHYTRCGHCSAHLHFTQITDFSRNITQESTRCPECGIRPSRFTHRLQ